MLEESDHILTQNIYLIHSNNTCIIIVFMKGTIHSLDQKMIGQHYGLQKYCFSIDLEDLHKNRAPRGQGFGSEISLHGILGASDLASGLGNNIGASGV